MALISVPENYSTTSAITTVVATPESHGDTLTYSISGGADQGDFAINANTGALTFVSSPDYENPTNANHDNVYLVDVTATDATNGGTHTSQNLYISVTNVVEPGDPPPLNTGSSGGIPTGGGGGATTPSGNESLASTGFDQYILGSQTGQNTIIASGGMDSVDGGPSNDSISGGFGSNFIRGFSGDDTIFAGTGADTINGNLGNDSIVGGSGNSYLFGGQGDDTVVGGTGNELLNGNIGQDIVYAGTGNDTLYGGQGDDTIYGGPGNDSFSGDLGNDIMYAGSGTDRFGFAPGGGHDWIGGFNAAHDTIVLPVGTQYTVVNYAGQAVIELSTGDTLGLAGVSYSSFSSSWVTFS